MNLFQSISKAFVRSQVFTSSAEKLLEITGRLLIDDSPHELVTSMSELEVYHPCNNCKDVIRGYRGVSCSCQVMILRFKGRDVISKEHVKNWKLHRDDKPSVTFFEGRKVTRQMWHLEGKLKGVISYNGSRIFREDYSSNEPPSRLN